MLTAETTQAAFAFLLSVGNLAANELRERWTFRRQKAKMSEEKEIDLAQENEQEATKSVEILLSDHSETDVKQTLDLVQRKRKLIYDAQRGKLNAEEEFNEGRITLDMFELRKERYNQTIHEKLADIEVDIQSLGIQINKEPI